MWASDIVSVGNGHVVDSPNPVLGVARLHETGAPAFVTFRAGGGRGCRSLGARCP